MAVTYSESSASTVPAVKRVSWGAIFVGVVIAMVVQLLLGILGLAIGASVVDPQEAGNPMDGFGMGAGIYWIVSSVISLFAGGYAAGALSRMQNHHDRTLHGLTVWGLAALFLFLMIGSGVGGLIGGAASVISGGASMAGDALSSVGPRAADAVQRRIESDVDVDLSEWREEVRQLLRDSGVPAIQPDRLQEQGEELEQDARSAARRTGQDPQRANRELESLLDQIQREGRETLRSVDREALVNIVTERTDQSRQEAARTVANWEQSYQQARQAASEQWDEAKVQAEEKARDWGDEAADGIATAAWWTFFMLLLGAFAAAGGANVGANRLAVAHEDTVVR